MTPSRIFGGLVVLLFGTLRFSGCDAVSSDAVSERGLVTLTGHILNEATNNPVVNGFVRVLPYDLLFEADSSGSFSFQVEVDSTMDLEVIGNADGYE